MAKGCRFLDFFFPVKPRSDVLMIDRVTVSLTLPFQTAPPPVWPGPCLCCWSPSAATSLGLSGWLAVCPYLEAAPGDFQSKQRKTSDA